MWIIFTKNKNITKQKTENFFKLNKECIDYHMSKSTKLIVKMAESTRI